MAANIPTNPTAGADDSNIFRRSRPKPVPISPPEEPTELLEFDELPPAVEDDEDALGELGHESHTGESPSMIVRRGYREGSGVNLGGGGKPSGDSGSSIFANAPAMAPSAPGSGWFDSVPPLPKSQVVIDLFAGLDADSSTASVAGWKKQPATDSISESEVLRAFDGLSSRDVTKRLPHPDDAADFDVTQPSGSHIFPHSREAKPEAGEVDSDASGVDLLNADWDSERITGPRSSIFGSASNQEASQIELDAVPPELGDEATGDNVLSDAEGGSSIFNKNTPPLSYHEQDDAVDFTEPMPGTDDEASARVSWETKPLSGEMRKSPSDDDDDSEVDPFADDLPMLHTPAPMRGPVGTSGAGAVVAHAKARMPDEDEDEEETIEAPKPKREPVRVKAAKAPTRSGGGGLIGWVGGGLLGLLIGAGAFAGLYFGGMLPSAETKSTGTVVQTTGPNPEVTALTAKQEEMKQELATAKDAAIKAERDMAFLKKKADFDAASAGYAKDLVKAAEAKADAKLKTAIKQKDAAEVELKAAMADLIKADDDAKKAKLDTAKIATELKTATGNIEIAKAETKVYIALNDKNAKEVETAKQDALDKAKLAADAQAKVTDAFKKQIAAEAGMTAVVKELKANKLLEDKVAPADALALLPEVFKRLNAMVASADAKKATEAMAALKRDLDASVATVKATETARDKALADATAAKKTADAAVKKAEADVLAAKKDADANASAAIEKAASEANAKLAAVEMEKLALQAGFTQQLAEARQGGVQITPAEVQVQDRAARDYNAGVSAYQSKSFTKALAALESAVKLNPADARYWYYLGLTQWELGRTTEAPVAFKKGFDLETRNKPNAAMVGEALERIQGNARKELNRHR